MFAWFLPFDRFSVLCRYPGYSFSLGEDNHNRFRYCGFEPAQIHLSDIWPGIRALSRQFGVSVSTVLQAHQTLEARGYLEARERSGYFVHLPRWDTPEPVMQKHKARPMPVSARGAAVARSFPEGTAVSRPQGGFVLWVQLPGNTSGTEVYRRAREENINVAAGLMFSTTDKYENCLRLNGANPWSERIEQAIGRLGAIATAVSAES